MYKSSLSSSCHVMSTDFPNPLSPLVSMVHLVSEQSFCWSVLADRPILTHSCEGFHRNTLFMSSFLLLLQCPACLVCLIWMVFEMAGRSLYSCSFVGCCFQDLFSIVYSILVQLLSNFFSIHLVNVHVVYPYSSIDMTTARKKLRFILSDVSVYIFTTYLEQLISWI